MLALEFAADGVPSHSLFMSFSIVSRCGTHHLEHLKKHNRIDPRIGQWRKIDKRLSSVTPFTKIILLLLQFVNILAEIFLRSYSQFPFPKNSEITKAERKGAI